MTGASVLFDAPGPRARVRNGILTAVSAVIGTLVVAFVLWQLWTKNQLTSEKWEPFLTANL